MFHITGLYAGLISLLFICLSARVILYRRREKISLGDRGDGSLLRLVRAQANCGEYAPLGVILLALIEAQGAPGFVTHGLGLMLLAGRVFHALGLWQDPQNLTLRVAGMGLSLTMISLAALGLIFHGMF